MALGADVTREIERAERRFGPFTSAHEGYGVLAEEVAELLAAVHANKSELVRAEAIQVASVALRIAHYCRSDSAFYERSGFNGRA